MAFGFSAAETDAAPGLAAKSEQLLVAGRQLLAQVRTLKAAARSGSLHAEEQLEELADRRPRLLALRAEVGRLLEEDPGAFSQAAAAKRARELLARPLSRHADADARQARHEANHATVMIALGHGASIKSVTGSGAVMWLNPPADPVDRAA